MTPLARTVGTTLAVTAIVLAFAAAAQSQAWSGGVGTSGGLLPWLFAAFAAAALVGVFLFVLWIVSDPRERHGDEPHGVARRRV